MRKIALTIALTAAGTLAFCDEILDDFSQKGWSLYKSTPGKMIVKKNHLELEDKVDKTGWVTVGKNFTVDLDKTPLLVLKVASLTKSGEAKVIRPKPYAKKKLLDMKKPGVYKVDIPKACGWKGKVKLHLALYTIGDGSKITYEYVKFTDKLTPQEQKELAK